MTESIGERYLRLGLALGRQVDGIVDAYFGHSVLVPAEKIERIINAVIEEAREQTRRDFDLPAGEGVVVEIVHALSVAGTAVPRFSVMPKSMGPVAAVRIRSPQVNELGMQDDPNGPADDRVARPTRPMPTGPPARRSLPPITSQSAPTATEKPYRSCWSHASTPNTTRTAAVNVFKALVLTAPDQLRESLRHTFDSPADRRLRGVARPCPA